MTKEIILDFLSSHKTELHDRFGLVKIGLFGSFARDEQTDASDIDLAVEIQSANAFRSFFALKHYLEEHLNRNVDLGIESSLKPTVREQIKSEIIYAR